ncbi:MAG: recombinase family protein [Bacteroidota bacterium]
MMKIGYARLSDVNQDSQLQVDELKYSGCERIFMDKPGEFDVRSELEKMIGNLQEGDIVVVCKLDRIGKSLKDLIGLLDSFRSRSIEFVSLEDHIDTTVDKGCFYEMMVALSEFESRTSSEKIMKGLTNARKKGRKGGRPKGLSDEALEIAREARALYRIGKMPVGDIIGQLGIGKTTLYRYLRDIDEDLIQKRGSRIRESDKNKEKKILRRELFNKLVESKAFWSYSNVNYEGISDEMLIQKVMINLDINDIKKLFILYNKNQVRKVWKDKLVMQDPHYRSLNLLIAKLFFDIQKPEAYIKRQKREYLKSISA